MTNSIAHPFPEALKKLERLNAIILNNDILRSWFVTGQYNYLQAIQTDLFYFLQRKNVSLQRSPLVKIREAVLVMSLTLIEIIVLLGQLIKRPLILLYAVDVLGMDHIDSRLEGVYKTLKDERVYFREYFHGPIRWSTIKHIWIRRRVGFYGGLVRWWSQHLLSSSPPTIVRQAIKSFNLTEADQTDTRDLLFLAALWVANFKSQEKIVSRLLNYLRPKYIFAIDDMRLDYFILLAAAKRSGIPVYVFQHGHLTRYHLGWRDMTGGQGQFLSPTTFFVWSQYWRDELQRLGTYLKPNQVVVGGDPKGQSALRSCPDQIPNPNKDQFVVLMPYEAIAPFKEVLDYLKVLLANSEVIFYLKVRPDQAVSQQLKPFGDLASRFKVVSSLTEIKDYIDVVIGTYSTFLYEMVAIGKPVAILSTSLDYAEGMIANGLADLVNDKEGDILSQLKKITQINQAVLRDRQDRLQSGGLPISQTVRKLLE